MTENSSSNMKEHGPLPTQRWVGNGKYFLHIFQLLDTVGLTCQNEVHGAYQCLPPLATVTYE